MSKNDKNIDSKYLMHIYLEARTSELLELIQTTRGMYAEPETLTMDQYNLIYEGCSFVFSAIRDLVEDADALEEKIDKELKVLHDIINETNEDR